MKRKRRGVCLVLKKELPYVGLGPTTLLSGGVFKSTTQYNTRHRHSSNDCAIWHHLPCVSVVPIPHYLLDNNIV